MYLSNHRGACSHVALKQRCGLCSALGELFEGGGLNDLFDSLEMFNEMKVI